MSDPIPATAAEPDTWHFTPKQLLAFIRERDAIERTILQPAVQKAMYEGVDSDGLRALKAHHRRAWVDGHFETHRVGQARIDFEWGGGTREMREVVDKISASHPELIITLSQAPDKMRASLLAAFGNGVRGASDLARSVLALIDLLEHYMLSSLALRQLHVVGHEYMGEMVVVQAPDGFAYIGSEELDEAGLVVKVDPATGEAECLDVSEEMADLEREEMEREGEPGAFEPLVADSGEVNEIMRRMEERQAERELSGHDLEGFAGGDLPTP